MALRSWLQQSKEFILRFAVSSPVPASWLYDVPESTEIEDLTSTPEHIEIVSHCWNYSHLFVYQLKSLLDNAPEDFKVTLTGFYCPEDKNTVALIKEYESKQVDNIEWNFIALNKGDLLRRGIGRNKAAKETKADWIWFTDCDLLFGENTFPSLKQTLRKESCILAFPEQVSRTSLLSEEHDVLCNGKETSVEECLQQADFTTHTFSKASGPVQIVHGDTARRYGYCEQIDCYQQPKDRWVKTYEDRAFRWLLGTHGKPLNIDDVSIIRHVEKGRYKKNSTFSEMRKANRQAKDKLLAK
ncbi:glycosyltransferase [Idiomarina abyssalis]|uniref:glycosyltransferase n=1 Tax=Idiomarina abyssalis TaxID=86102 RepID=UPI003A918FD4